MDFVFSRKDSYASEQGLYTDAKPTKGRPPHPPQNAKRRGIAPLLAVWRVVPRKAHFACKRCYEGLPELFSAGEGCSLNRNLLFHITFEDLILDNDILVILRDDAIGDRRFRRVFITLKNYIHRSVGYKNF